MHTMKNLTYIAIAVAAVFALAACEDKNRVDVRKEAKLPFVPPASLKLETIVAKDFVKHRNFAADPVRNEGLTSTIDFTYPAEFSNAEVLRTLQLQFLGYALGEEAAAAFPEDATTRALVSDWIKEYFKTLLAVWNAEFAAVNSKDRPVESWVRERHAHVLFANDALIQLRTRRHDDAAGERVPMTVSAHLFDLATAKEYSQADIFNVDDAEKIRGLVIDELLKYWATLRTLATETKAVWEPTASLAELQKLYKDSKKHDPAKWRRKPEVLLPDLDEAGKVKFDKEAVWTPKTAFAVTPEGIAVFYSDGELGSSALGCPAVTIPYATILPHLREGTPVHDLARTKAE